MRQLIVLRHAKASTETGEGDHERPLTARGRADAQQMGKEMAARGFKPTLAVCSSSRRTTETLALVAPFLEPSPEIAYEHALYLAPLELLLRHASRIDDRYASVLMVGHNPGFEELALHLAGKSQLAFRIEDKFPTTALAVFDSATSTWANAAEGRWTLTDLVYPADI